MQSVFHAFNYINPLIKSYTKEAGAKECFFNVDSFEWLERYLIGLLGIKSVNTWKTVKVFDKKTFYTGDKIFVVEYKSDEFGMFDPNGKNFRTVLFGTFDGMPDYAVQYAKEIALNQEWKVIGNL